MPAEPVGAERGRLLDIRFQLQRRVEETGAEADVDQISVIGEIDLQQHVRLWPERTARRGDPARPPGEPGDLKAEGLKCGSEQQIVLETISAARAVDELGLHGSKVELDRTMEQRIDPFERDRLEMRSLERLQRRQIGRGRTAIADPRQIVFQPKRV